MRWTCICKMNLFPEKPSEERRNLIVVVQHKGLKTNAACRKQWPLLYFLLQGHHDGSNPDTEVPVLNSAYHQKPESVTLWLFPPLFSSLWKCGFFAICFTLERVILSVFHSFSLGDSVFSLFLSLPLEFASCESYPSSSGLLNPSLALKGHCHFCLIFVLSKCNLKTLEKQKLYLILRGVPKN